MKFSKAFYLAWALVLLALPLAAQMNPAGAKPCSLATLNGTYAFFGEGTLVGDPPIRIVTSGIMNYDGAGNISGESMNNVDGAGALPDTFTGTYVVNPDCTFYGQHTDPYGETLHFAATLSGTGASHGYNFMVTDPGWIAYGTTRKIPPEGCSLASLKGPYALYGQGTVTAYNPPALLTHVGTFTYDGKGNFAGKDTIALNGTTMADEFSGTYTVSANCTVSVEIHSSAVGVVHQFGRITGEGKRREVHLIITDPGFMFLESTRKQ